MVIGFWKVCFLRFFFDFWIYGFIVIYSSVLDLYIGKEIN